MKKLAAAVLNPGVLTLIAIGIVMCAAAVSTLRHPAQLSPMVSSVPYSNLGRASITIDGEIGSGLGNGVVIHDGDLKLGF